MPETQSHSSSGPSYPLDLALNKGLVWQAAQQPCSSARVISSGYQQLNRELPQGGWQAGQVCEIYPHRYGCGDMHILLPVLATLSHQQQWIMMVAPPAIPYAPALTMAGIDTRRLLMVHPKDRKEALWCVEEGLRSGHCSAVMGWLPESDPNSIRRIQLACEASKNFCWLWPDARHQNSASAAPLRLQVTRISAEQANLRFIKRRGRWPGNAFSLSLNSATRTG